MIHSRSAWADSLVFCLNNELNLPWLFHLGGVDRFLSGPDATNRHPRNELDAFISSADCVFYEHESQLHFLQRHSTFSVKRSVQFFGGFDPQVVRRLRDAGDRPQDGRFRFFIVQSDQQGERELRDAVIAVGIVNSLAFDDSSSQGARLVVTASESAADSIASWLSRDNHVELYRGPLDPLEAMIRCDAVLILHDSTTAEASCMLTAALACGRPVIAVERGPFHAMIAHEGRHAGILLPRIGEFPVGIDHLVAAMLEYLTNPALFETHRRNASWIFDERYTIDRIAAACAEAYVDACNVIQIPERATRPGPLDDGSLDRGNTTRRIQGFSPPRLSSTSA